VSRRWRHEQAWRNSLTTLPFWVAGLLMAGGAVHWSQSSRALGLLALAFMTVYSVIYWRLARLPPPLRRKPATRRSRAALDRPAPQLGPPD
jgi:hypothetical protein